MWIAALPGRARNRSTRWSNRSSARFRGVSARGRRFTRSTQPPPRRRSSSRRSSSLSRRSRRVGTGTGHPPSTAARFCDRGRAATSRGAQCAISSSVPLIKGDTAAYWRSDADRPHKRNLLRAPGGPRGAATITILVAFLPIMQWDAMVIRPGIRADTPSAMLTC